MAGKAANSRVIGTDTKERSRTLVQLHLVGHASPRWRSATNDKDADRRNAILAESRAQAVRRAVERQIRAALPGHELNIRHDYNVADESQEQGGVIIGTESRGSRDTIDEAGDRGRKANEEKMRRVDVTVDLSKFTDATVFKDLEETRYISSATREWAISTTFSASAQAGAGIVYFAFQLKNRRTNQVADGRGFYSKAGFGINAAPEDAALTVAGAGASWGGFVDFKTKALANFSDFDHVRVSMVTAELSLGIIGYQAASMTMFNLPGGAVMDVSVGGFGSGKFGVDLGSVGYGLMWLEGDPTRFNTHPVKARGTVVKEHERGQSVSTGGRGRHRVTFATGVSQIAPNEEASLAEYVEGAVKAYEAKDWRGPLAGGKP